MAIYGAFVWFGHCEKQKRKLLSHTNTDETEVGKEAKYDLDCQGRHLCTAVSIEHDDDQMLLGRDDPQLGSIIRFGL
jgi:hypothetical protein